MSLLWPHRGFARLLIDSTLVAGAATWAWFASVGQLAEPGSPLPFLAVVVAVRLPIYFAFRLHRVTWRKVSRQDLFGVARSAALGAPLIGLLLHFLPEPFSLRGLARPYLVLVTEPVLYLVLLSGMRICFWAIASRRRQRKQTRILIVGTGDAARSLVWQLQESATDYRVVGLVDNDPQLLGGRILGLSVVGMIHDLARLAARHGVEQVIVAMPCLPSAALRQVVEICEPMAVPVRILPSLRNLMQRGAGVDALQEVRMESLLARPEITFDDRRTASFLCGRTVLVTGGGGSIGSELCRRIVRAGASRLLVLGRGENSVFEIVQELAALNEHCDVIPVICDVQDRVGLGQIFERFHPQVVFHAAAHKHVPLMEQYPSEAVKTNVLGTLNAVTLSVEHGTKCFVLVSTDKAVNPRSVMGTTKRVAEMIVRAYAMASDANMVSVRFGNVLGSRGSVIPLMSRQIRNGEPVTVTCPEMVRFFMTIPEAAQLILEAATTGGRGDVFVLDIGHPLRIVNLAEALIRAHGLEPHRDVPIQMIGRRAGEKLGEDLLNRAEKRKARKNGKYYIVPAEPVDLDKLLEQVTQLRAAALRNDQENLIRALRSIVPSYRRNVADRENGWCGQESEVAATAWDG